MKSRLCRNHRPKRERRADGRAAIAGVTTIGSQTQRRGRYWNESRHRHLP